MGRNKDIIVLPNGFNVYPEDIENALRVAGIRDSVVVETRPGRIEAIVLAPGSHGLPQGGDIPAAGPGAARETPALVRERIDASVKAANQTLAVHQRVAGWRLWPDVDFPRTHTLKVKRDLVRGLGRRRRAPAGPRGGVIVAVPDRSGAAAAVAGSEAGAGGRPGA